MHPTGDATLHAASKLTCADIPLKSAPYHHLSSRTPARKHDETHGPKQRQLLNTNIGRGFTTTGALRFPWIGVSGRPLGLGWSASLPTHAALVLTPRTTYPPHASPQRNYPPPPRTRVRAEPWVPKAMGAEVLCRCQLQVPCSELQLDHICCRNTDPPH